MEDYAPRSPDLSGINPHPPNSQDHSQYSYPPPPPVRDDSSFSMGSSFYYQPPPLPNQESSTAFSHSGSFYEPPPPKLESQPSWPIQPPTPQSRPRGRPKRENKQDGFPPPNTSQPPAAKARKPSVKSSRPPPPEPEPRPPAPGDEEGIVVRTKFPVARIKRIVQADEEVGKVAQSTPVAVGKALELFMIQMSLSAIAELGEGSSGRLTAQHIKTAINKDDKFDFLTEIGEKIPEGPQGKGEGKERKPKAERATSEEDMDMDADFDAEAPKSVRKRRKRKPAEED